MKKLLLLLALAVTAMTSWAYEGERFEDGNFAYYIAHEPTSTTFGRAYITGLTSTAKTTSNLALSIPTRVVHNSTSYYVRRIDDKAFQGQTNITGVNIGYGVEYIGYYVFDGCTSMTYVRMPSSIVEINANAFNNCSKLKYIYSASPKPPLAESKTFSGIESNSITVYVPKTSANSVENYQNASTIHAPGWTELKKASYVKSSYAYDVYCSDGAYLCVTTQPMVNTVGEMAIVGFTTSGSLVTDGALVPSCGSGNYSFSGLSYKLTSIADSACLNSTVIKSVDLSNCSNIATIGVGAFRNCTALTTAKLKASAIGRYSFFGCSALSSLTLCEGVLSVHEYTFNECSSLTSLTLPSTMKSYGNLGTGVTNDCPKFSSISVASGNNYYSSCNSMLYDKAGTTLYMVPEAYNSGIINKFLTDDKFSPTLTTIGPRAFRGTNLTTVEIPYGVTSIGAYAFINSAVTGIKIPSTVTDIDVRAFNSASGLEKLWCNTSTPISFSSDPFASNKKTTLFVPYASLSAYKSANYWKTWGTITYGAYDFGAYSYTATDNSSSRTGYNMVSKKKETINGYSYSGRASLVYQGATASGTLVVPSAIGASSGDTYAVTSIGENVFPIKVSAGINLKIGENVDTIKYQAFIGQQINTLSMGQNVKVIEMAAFYSCHMPCDIILPYGLKTIGQAAFYYNYGKRILVPSSVTFMYYDCFAENSKLEELILNNTWCCNSDWLLTNVPTTTKVYVPVGVVNQYRFSKTWSNYDVSAGAYDFCYNNNHGTTRYYMTVTSATPVTVGGVTYAGKAKFVYNPVIKSLISSSSTKSFVGSTSMNDTSNGGKKTYLMTEFGDSCLSFATDCPNVTVPEYLERVGSYAFYGSGITKMTIPATCTYIGEYAWFNCASLTELFLTQQTGSRSWGGQFFGNNAESFVCYVPWRAHYDYQKSATNWGQYSSSKKPADQINGYLQITGNNTTTSFSINHPVDWTAAGLKAYIVKSYDATKKQVVTVQAYRTKADEGLLVEGFTKDAIYKLTRPTTVGSYSNLLVGDATATVDVYGQTVGYLYDGTNKYFWKPTASYTLGRGYAYLKLTSAQAGTTTKVTVDLWDTTIKGDVNGDGKVDTSDITALINHILGTATYANADVDGNGTIDTSDITALSNIILGA